MILYTGKGDDGTTGLYMGGRVSKTDPIIHATGAVDEAQAAIGFARAEIRNSNDATHDSELTDIERNLWILMAEINVDDGNRSKLEPGKSLVTQEMLDHLERLINGLSADHEIPNDFVIPGQDEISARLDLARVAVRRAERECVGVLPGNSLAIPYLNRLSSYLWVLSRVFEKQSLLSKEGK